MEMVWISKARVAQLLKAKLSLAQPTEQSHTALFRASNPRKKRTRRPSPAVTCSLVCVVDIFIDEPLHNGGNELSDEWKTYVKMLGDFTRSQSWVDAFGTFRFHLPPTGSSDTFVVKDLNEKEHSYSHPASYLDFREYSRRNPVRRGLWSPILVSIETANYEMFRYLAKHGATVDIEFADMNPPGIHPHPRGMVAHLVRQFTKSEPSNIADKEKVAKKTQNITKMIQYTVKKSNRQLKASVEALLAHIIKLRFMGLPDPDPYPDNRSNQDASIQACLLLIPKVFNSKGITLTFLVEEIERMLIYCTGPTARDFYDGIGMNDAVTEEEVVQAAQAPCAACAMVWMVGAFLGSNNDKRSAIRSAVVGYLLRRSYPGHDKRPLTLQVMFLRWLKRCCELLIEEFATHVHDNNNRLALEGGVQEFIDVLEYSIAVATYNGPMVEGASKSINGYLPILSSSSAEETKRWADLATRA